MKAGGVSSRCVHRREHARCATARTRRRWGLVRIVEPRCAGGRSHRASRSRRSASCHSVAARAYCSTSPRLRASTTTSEDSQHANHQARPLRRGRRHRNPSLCTTRGFIAHAEERAIKYPKPRLKLAEGSRFLLSNAVMEADRSPCRRLCRILIAPGDRATTPWISSARWISRRSHAQAQGRRGSLNAAIGGLVLKRPAGILGIVSLTQRRGGRRVRDHWRGDQRHQSADGACIFGMAMWKEWKTCLAFPAPTVAKPISCPGEVLVRALRLALTCGARRAATPRARRVTARGSTAHSHPRKPAVPAQRPPRHAAASMTPPA